MHVVRQGTQVVQDTILKGHYYLVPLVDLVVWIWQYTSISSTPLDTMYITSNTPTPLVLQQQQWYQYHTSDQWIHHTRQSTILLGMDTMYLVQGVLIGQSCIHILVWQYYPYLPSTQIVIQGQGYIMYIYYYIGQVYYHQYTTRYTVIGLLVVETLRDLSRWQCAHTYPLHTQCYPPLSSTAM